MKFLVTELQKKGYSILAFKVEASDYEVEFKNYSIGWNKIYISDPLYSQLDLGLKPSVLDDRAKKLEAFALKLHKKLEKDLKKAGLKYSFRQDPAVVQKTRIFLELSYSHTSDDVKFKEIFLAQ